MKNCAVGMLLTYPIAILNSIPNNTQSFIYSHWLEITEINCGKLFVMPYFKLACTHWGHFLPSILKLCLGGLGCLGAAAAAVRTGLLGDEAALFICDTSLSLLEAASSATSLQLSKAYKT